MKLFVVLSVLALAFSNAVDQLRDFLKTDTCAVDAVQPFKSQIQTAVQALKINQSDKAALNSLVQITNQACETPKSIQALKGDPVKFAGISLLLASNCFKDLGAVLLIVDSVFLDPSDIQNDIIVAIFSAILSLQSYKDCGQFINYIRK